MVSTKLRKLLAESSVSKVLSSFGKLSRARWSLKLLSVSCSAESSVAEGSPAQSSVAESCPA